MEKIRKEWKTFLGKRECQLFIFMFLVCIACCRYFYKILSYPCYYYDEVNELSIVTGFMKTKTFFGWDFIHNNISDVPYTRAWTYTVLLAGWLKIFGNTLLSARCLSAIIGILFIVSVIYIVKKEVNTRTAVFTVLILLANTETTYMFRFVRMYGLGMLLSIWAAYFFFKAIIKQNNFKNKNALCNFVAHTVNFNFAYMIIALIVFYLAYVTHINTLVIAGGIILFLFYLAISCKEKKYVISSITVLVLCGLLIIGMKVPAIYNNFNLLLSVRDHLVNMTKIRDVMNDMTLLVTDMRTEYIYFFVDVIGNRTIVVFTLLLFLMKLLQKRKEKNFLIYCLLIFIVGIVFFVFVSNRYFKGRYCIFLIPFFSIMIASGIDYFLEILMCKYKIILTLPFFMVLCISVVNGRYIYTQSDCGNFIPAYTKMLENCDKDEKVAIMGVQFMGYYFNDISEEYDCVVYDLSDFNFESFINIATQYQDGMVAIDLNKFRNVDERMQYFMTNWMNRISGAGIDEYNVEISKYHLIKESEPFTDADLIYENDFVKYNFQIANDRVNWKIQLKCDNISSDMSLMCIELLSQNTEGVTERNCVQLEIEENGKGFYEVSMPTNGEIQAVCVGDNYAYFNKEGMFIY